ncbi:amino acid ABC transporter ATP-binding protein [Actinoallomurus sp. CA-150999]|uniref:amino acid ABC transporter ATP-binding protein n=1 Tax=Actinoallomurus sp. CA-150999 TaxID=3239887 RepID=UPI003D8DB1D7
MTIERPAVTKAAQPADDGPVVRIDGLGKSFDGRVVLDDIGLDVRSGDIVSILGASGGGKSTLLRCVNLLERPDRGTIEVAGEPVFANGRVASGDLARLRQRVGMVFQRFHLFPHLTAVENVVLAQIKAAGVREDEAIATAVRLLRRVGLAHRALAFPEQMSGGEQQRVAIARALALRPAVLLFDEPTSALDPESTGEVLRVMRDLADDGMTMMIVTHEVPFAREISDWVAFIDSGRVVEEGPAAQVLDDPRQTRTQAFLRSYRSSGR